MGIGDWLTKKAENFRANVRQAQQERQQKSDDAVSAIAKKNPDLINASSTDEFVLKKIKGAVVKNIKPTTAYIDEEFGANDYLEVWGNSTPITNQLKSLRDNGTPAMVEVTVPVFINDQGQQQNPIGAIFAEDGMRRVADFLKSLKEKGIIKNGYFFTGEVRLIDAGGRIYGDNNQIFLEKSDWDGILQYEISQKAGSVLPTVDPIEKSDTEGQVIAKLLASHKVEFAKETAVFIKENIGFDQDIIPKHLESLADTGEPKVWVIKIDGDLSKVHSVLEGYGIVDFALIQKIDLDGGHGMQKIGYNQLGNESSLFITDNELQKLQGLHRDSLDKKLHDGQDTGKTR